MASLIGLLFGCGGGGSDLGVSPSPGNADTSEGESVPVPDLPAVSETDLALNALIDALALRQSPLAGRTLPDITDPLAQLGKKLFYSKSLSGEFDVACASCHHPMLGGGDGLSLPVGINALQSDVLGVGRRDADGVPNVPRNSPTTFNVGLWDQGLFWDSRVESLGKEALQNGAASPISTPESGTGIADPNAGHNLVMAQARFPVTSVDEMKGMHFEANSNNTQIRDHLAARIGDIGLGAGELALNQWLFEFQQAFNSGDDAETLITFDNIALALGEFQRSMVFVENPWQSYLSGDVAALNESAKRGAILFFTAASEGGAGCAACHRGPLFSDEQHHTIAFPQIGVGKTEADQDDTGRELVSGDADDRYRFRTPSLLNIAVTAPYGHAGAYDSLDEVLAHYNNPRDSVQDYFDRQAWCDLPQFENVANCSLLFPNGATNTEAALSKLQQERRENIALFENININPQERRQLADFLDALTDPCVTSRACLAPWIAEQASDSPDGQRLIATDISGAAL
nr:cytochrome c peroxidase [Thaumasiovibrio subtropicus]